MGGGVSRGPRFDRAIFERSLTLLHEGGCRELVIAHATLSVTACLNGQNKFFLVRFSCVILIVGGKTKNPVNRVHSTELKTTCHSLIVTEAKGGKNIFLIFCYFQWFI